MQTKRRNEYFRFEFDQPIDATFRIIEINGVEKISKPAEVKIRNISPKGVKLLTNLDFQLNNVDKIKVEIRFSLNSNSPIEINGKLIWQKKELSGYNYGVQMESTEESKKQIVEELKKFTRNMKSQ